MELDDYVALKPKTWLKKPHGVLNYPIEFKGIKFRIVHKYKHNLGMVLVVYNDDTDEYVYLIEADCFKIKSPTF